MTTDLTSQKCEACTIDAPKVTKEESNQLIKMLDNWFKRIGFGLLVVILTE